VKIRFMLHYVEVSQFPNFTEAGTKRFKMRCDK